MAVRLRGKVWQVDVTLAGHGRLRPTFETEGEARTWERDAIHAAQTGRPLPDTGTNIKQGGGRISVLKDLVPEVEQDWLAEGASAFKDLSRNLRCFVDWFGERRHPSEIDETTLDRYSNYLRTEKQNMGSTVNRKMSAVRVLLKKAKRYKLITSLPEFTKLPETKGSLNFLNFGEEEPVLKKLDHLGYDALHDLVSFLIDTGCRINEALSVEWKTIRGDRVTFENRKNGQFGTVPLTKRAAQALKNRKKLGTDPDRPFGDINYDGARGVLRSVYSQLGGEFAKITQPFHIYRHSCASRLAIKNVNAKRIMEWMDHSSIIVTQRYMKLAVSDLDEARNALEAA
ncbi:tyrosine-type recombinase/integrase [Brucella haematophila]|uniref:tyrosine-type recombinase/integrase n=1 Tax=Brucella haematophila TaxID=419474 RepID=UPI00110F49AC|nr:site-specific integrase [Brucella haematophila]TMV03627.1 site-specific integrase [Brucella haematophila]